jgi:hypothetical protein
VAFVDVLGVPIRARSIMKAAHFAARQYQSTNGVWIAWAPFQTVPKVDRISLIFVSLLRTFSSMSSSDKFRCFSADQPYLFRCSAENFRCSAA